MTGNSNNNDDNSPALDVYVYKSTPGDIKNGTSVDVDTVDTPETDFAADRIGTILGEATRLGITLDADSGKIQFRPRKLMTDDLANRIRASKPELLKAIEHVDREWLRFWAVAVERPSGNGWTDPGAWPNGEPWWMDADAWPIRNPDPTPWPEIPEGTPGPLADLARERPGWAVEAWRDRLRQLAKACADANPERSGELRQAAELILT